MAKVGISFQLSANAAGMSAGINAGVVELQKLGYAAKQTSQDVSVLKTLQIGQAFLSGIRTITTTFTQFTSGASSAIDQSNKLSRALGISFEELRQLQLAADLAGANSEQLANAFTRAQVTITKAARGGVEATRALRSLGLSVAELAGLSASQQFERIATAVATIQDPAQRAAAAVAIFGRSGAQLLPVFQELSSNLQRAEGFFGGFQRRLGANDASQIEAVNDAFTEVGAAVQELAGLVIARLSPALLRGAENLKSFIQNVDVDRVVRIVADSLERLAQSAQIVGRVASVALERPLFAVGVALAYVNREAIKAGILGLASSFSSAGVALKTFSASAIAAAAAASALKVALRGLATATLVGTAGVLFGFAVEKTLDYFGRSSAAAQDLTAEINGNQDAIRDNVRAMQAFGDAATEAGKKAKDALNAPQVSFISLAQDSLNEAASAVSGLAKELGSLNRVPGEIRNEFARIGLLVERANTDLVNQKNLAIEINTRSRQLTESLKAQAEARKADTDAAQKAAEEARKINEASRDNVRELAERGLSPVDKSRLQLSRDLVDIERERQQAQQQLAEAERSFLFEPIRAARERLRLVDQAAKVAQEENRQRRLQALGIDESILRPARTLADEFQAVRDAFQQGLIDPDEARNALRNLAREGIEIRREIDRELSRPSSEALRVADIRSSEGISEFLAAGRRDPAVDQRQEQIAKLEEIRQALIKIGVAPVDILGAA